MGIGPDGIPEVRDEPRSQDVVLPLDLHADRVDRAIQVLILDHGRPVQRFTGLALRTRLARDPRRTRGARGASLPRWSGRSHRTRITLAGK